MKLFYKTNLYTSNVICILKQTMSLLYSDKDPNFYKRVNLKGIWVLSDAFRHASSQ